MAAALSKTRLTWTGDQTIARGSFDTKVFQGG
jgi:hypothetical protein